MKYFIITIDTEGDNLWGWKIGDHISTENSIFLSRFQILCNKYGYKPVWLTNWEMIHDNRFTDFVALEAEKKNCEIGMHLHAWNTPPFYNLPSNNSSGAPYLIEYPQEIIEEKIDKITFEFKKIFGLQPYSHRAGRWAINDSMLSVLHKYGYTVDCSITPGIDWRKSKGQTQGFKGPDYRYEKNGVSIRQGMVEVPLTTIDSHYYSLSTLSLLKGEEKVKYIIKGIIKKHRILYLRPNGHNIAELKWMIKRMENTNIDYLMFMIHSSELMPGGSNVFRDVDSIEKLYFQLDEIFDMVSESYIGIALKDYASMYYKKLDGSI